MVLEARTVERLAGSYKKDEHYINGMPEYTVDIKEHISVNNASIILHNTCISIHFLIVYIFAYSYRRVQW